MRIAMVAAENAALPGGKVGGMGDVVRDVPRALVRQGHSVDVIMPGYGRFSHLPGAEHRATLKAPFRHGEEPVELYRVLPEKNSEQPTLWILEHPLFSACGSGRIYCDDPPWRPFASDASKFALFCSAVTSLLMGRRLRRPDVLHLHDWHSALTAVLIHSKPELARLRRIRSVFTIHNLALQGIRPWRGDESSLEAWFPGLQYDVHALIDPRYGDCYNPMRAAISLCDRIHAVSPRYAQEIQQPPAHGMDPGAGLHRDLAAAQQQGRLVGILNGCEYPDQTPQKPALAEILDQAASDLPGWIGRERAARSAHMLALQRIAEWRQDTTQRPFLVTSVGRLTDQKVALLRELQPDGRSTMEHLLRTLKGHGRMIVLGSGDPVFEDFLTEVAGRHESLLFLSGYSEPLSEQLYAAGSLFLMPSSFEPCGISQMLAMREGQPCLVHAVGGLADTVQDGVDGFSFSGDSPQEQAQALLQRFREVLDLHDRQPEAFGEIAGAAAAARFAWETVAAEYLEHLYS
jgi:starch synthase